MKIENYKLELYKPSGEYMGELIVDNLSADIKLTDISSISFEIPTYINGQPNPRINEVFDTYEVVLSYGDLSSPKIRFVIYETPTAFEEHKYSHTYSGFSDESKLEQRQIVSWPGIQKSRSYFVAKPGAAGYTINAGTPPYILFNINSTVLDEDLEIYEVRENNEVINESPLIPYDSGSALSFARGYYERVSPTTLKIALDDTATYNDMLSNLTDYYFKVYDNPQNSTRPIIYSGLNNSSGFTDYTAEGVEVEDEVSETLLGKTYQSELYFSKDGLKLSQILSDLLKDSDFTFEIESSIDELYRSNIEFNNISIYQALKNVVETYKAVLITDTINKKFYIYPDLVYGENRGLTIQYGSYLKSIQKEIDTTKIVTKTRGLGKDNLSITLITPTQDGYWEDYSYYLDEFLIDSSTKFTLSNPTDITTVSINNLSTLNSRWMSKNLAEKIAKWQFIRNYYHAVFNGETSYLGFTIPLSPDTSYSGIYLDRKELIENLVKEETLRDKAYAQELKYKYLKEHYEKLLANDGSNLDYTEQQEKYELLFEQYSAERAAKDISIEGLNTSIDSIGNLIKNVNNTKLNKNLTVNEQNELKNFVKEYIFSDSSYANDYDLLDGVLQYVEENKYPQVTLTVDIVDILAALDAEEDRDKLNIGDKINIYFPEFNIDAEAQIKEISINFDQNSIDLTISTTKRYNKGRNTAFASILRKVSDANKNIVKYNNDANKHSFEKTTDFNQIFTVGLQSGNTPIGAGMVAVDGTNPVTINSDGVTSSEIIVDKYTETISVNTSSKSIKFTNGSIIIKDNSTLKHIEMSVDNGFRIINDAGVKTFYVDANGNAVFSGTLTVLDDINDAIDQAESDAIAAANAYADQLASSLQSQIDNAITTWFGEGIPLPTSFDYTAADPDHTTNNSPTEDWPTPMTLEYLKLHVGDLYYDNLTGYAFRLSVISGGSTEVIADYKWVLIRDSAVIAALEAANTAQTTADGKMTFFTANSSTTMDTILANPILKDGDILLPSVTFTHTTPDPDLIYQSGTTYIYSSSLGRFIPEEKKAGTIGGWNISGSAIFSGLPTRTPAANDEFDTVGMTLGASGYISAKEFKINSSGDATFKGTLDAAKGTFGEVGISTGGKIEVGNITISPNGIAGTDGTNQTFLLDAQNGDVFIKGTMQVLEGSTFEDIITRQVYISGGVGSVTYNEDGSLPSGITGGTFSAAVYANGIDVTSSVTYSWSAFGRLSVNGAPTNSSIFSPTLNSTFADDTTYVQVNVTFADGKTLSQTQAVTITKKVKGDTGASASYVIVSGEQAFKYAAGDSTPSPTSITLTASLFGSLTTYDWEYWNGSTWTNLSGTQNTSTYSLAHNNAAWSTNNSLRVRCLSGSYSDEITIVKLYDGTDGVPGDPGDDAINSFLTNDTHTIAADKDGNVLAGEFALATTTMKIYLGLVDDTSNWSFSYSPSTGITMTTGNVFPITAMTTDTGTITVTATKTNFSSIQKIFTVTKSRQGEIGETGAEGKKAVSGIVYYQLTSESAPATPSATYYNLSTNSFFQLTANWSLTSPTFQSSNGAKYWYARFYGTEGTTENIVSQVTFTAPYAAINFSGLVTFTGAEGILSVANSNVTSIDGGLLTTAIINSSAEISLGKPKMTIDMNGQKLSIGQPTQGYGIEGIFLGYDSTQPKFSISGPDGISSGANYIAWTGNSLEIQGDIGGTIGEINVGDIVIDSDGISAYNSTNHILANRTFFLDSSNGNAFLKGTVNATAGTFGPIILANDKISVEPLIFNIFGPSSTLYSNITTWPSYQMYVKGELNDYSSANWQYLSSNTDRTYITFNGDGVELKGLRLRVETQLSSNNSLRLYAAFSLKGKHLRFTSVLYRTSSSGIPITYDLSNSTDNIVCDRIDFFIVTPYKPGANCIIYEIDSVYNTNAITGVLNSVVDIKDSSDNSSIKMYSGGSISALSATLERSFTNEYYGKNLFLSGSIGAYGNIPINPKLFSMLSANSPNTTNGASARIAYPIATREVWNFVKWFYIVIRTYQSAGGDAMVASAFVRKEELEGTGYYYTVSTSQSKYDYTAISAISVKINTIGTDFVTVDLIYNDAANNTTNANITIYGVDYN